MADFIIPDNIWTHPYLTLHEKMVLSVLYSNKEKEFTINELVKETMLTRYQVIKAANRLFFEHMLVHKLRQLASYTSIIIAYQYKGE